jgi:thioredoxin reductase
MLAESKSVGKVGDMDTSVPGVFAAGDLSAQMPQVAAAVAAGSMAAAAVVQSLLADQFGLPVPPRPFEKEDADAHA